MKKRLTLILALLLIFSAGAMAKKKQAEITFAHTTFDFGTIPEHGGKVSHTFDFTNTGDANLVIVDAKADCGCTVPEFPAAPIPPGGKGKVKVTYDPIYRPGSFHKVVTVQTNAKVKKARLKVSGTVNPNK